MGSEKILMGMDRLSDGTKINSHADENKFSYG